MALVDNFLGNHQHGSSRLMMIQARFQQRQQEEKEHKLFAMLEEQHDVAPGEGGLGGLIPAARTHSNGSSASQHTSASSTASLSSSMGSSLASSLGSTGSGMTAPGKVRQMFEDRRNQINGRPPAYAKNTETRRSIPISTRGWDRSHPLDPLPVNSHDRNQKMVTQQRGSRARGVSLERGAHAFPDGVSDSMRRSKSQYQVDDGVGGMTMRSSNKLPSPSDGQHLLAVSGSMKPKSMTSLLDDNQNNVPPPSKTIPRFGYNQSPVRNPSQRYQTSSYREDVVDNGNPGRTAGHQYRGRNQQDVYQTVDRMEESARQSASLAAAATAAAAEATRRLEREKAQIQAEAKRREEELMNTIRQQQQQLQRLQQAAAQAEQKAKAAAAAAVSRPSRPSRTPYRPPDESDDSKSSVSDEVVISPPSSRGWNPMPTMKKSSSSGATRETGPSAMKPKLAPKPVLVESPPTSPAKGTTMPRKSIFATGPGKDGLVGCSLCGRSFAADRIEKHESICAKTKAKKRKVFDITKMRVKGTEAESFVLAPAARNHQSNAANKKPISIGQHILQQQQLASKAAPAPSAKSSVKAEEGKKADWRKKHESFIEAIRAAKAVQKHLKAGGKVSDLPPPPPSDTSDYIQCPHCMRRFSPGAADRHIPKCANIKSNKPK